MGGNARSTEFLKECLADSLLKLMKKKEFSKITINEIANGANVNRSTWFRNFNTKSEVLTFKLVRLWNRWADEHGIQERNRFTLDNAKDFFQFNFEIRHILNTICLSGLQPAIYDAFYQVMSPQLEGNALECYESRFYSYGLFGLLDEWVKCDFRQTPEEMEQLLHEIIHT